MGAEGDDEGHGRVGPVRQRPSPAHHHHEDNGDDEQREVDAVAAEVTREGGAGRAPERDGRVQEAIAQPRPLLDVERQHRMAEAGADPDQVRADPGERSGDGRQTTGGLARRQSPNATQPLDDSRGREQDTRRTGEAREEAGGRRPPPPLRAQSEKHGHGQTAGDRLRVGEHEHEPRWDEGDEPRRSPGSSLVAAFPPHQADEQHCEQEGGNVRQHQERHVEHASEDVSEGAPEQRIQREEAKGGAGDRRVAVAGDPLVPLPVPRQQPLVQRLPAHVDVQVVVQVVGEGQHAQHERPGRDPSGQRDLGVSPEAARPRPEAAPHRGS